MTTSPDDIRASVSRSYAARVRPVLDRADGLDLPVLATGGGCCGTEAPASAPKFTTIDLDSSNACSVDGCCDTSSSDEEALTNIARLYAGTDTTDLPDSVTDVAFGCGNPTAIAALQPGETVLDLGSGGGIDCFLAAKVVGDTGTVFGVDMTPEMVRLARKNAEKVGAANVEFRLGEIEHLPFPDESIDVVISNCVINLSPDKAQVFREAFRVLRPGGRLQVSDIVWMKPVPEAVKADMEQWAGCVAGALEEHEYLAHIGAAGFTNITSNAREYPDGRGIASADIIAYR